MNLRLLVGCAFLFFGGDSVPLKAGDLPPLSHHPSDYQFQGTPVGNVSLAAYVVPLHGPDAQSGNYRFQVMIRNDSSKPVYLTMPGGGSRPLKLSVLDAAGQEHPLRETTVDLSPPQAPLVARPNDQVFIPVSVHENELKAMQGNSIVARAEVRSTPSPTDPQAQTFVIKTAPFRLCPDAPIQDSLPDDPMLVLWKLQEEQLRDQLDHATGPNDRAAAAEALAYHIVDCHGDFDQARNLLPQMQPEDRFDTQLILITRDLRLNASQMVEKIKLLQPDCPPSRKMLLDRMIGVYTYQVEHPVGP